MRNYNVKFIKGHLIDTVTGKSIFLKRGGSFSILGDDDQFVEKDEIEFRYETLNSKNKRKRLKAKHKNYLLERIAKSKQEFIFRVGLSKTTSEDKHREFLFNAIIREDLYLMSKDLENWTMCNCFCESTTCYLGDLQTFQKVPGKSLNNLFSNLIASYFPLQRSGSCNTFKTFYYFNDVDNENNYSSILANIKNDELESLEKSRKEIVKKYEGRKQGKLFK